MVASRPSRTQVTPSASTSNQWKRPREGDPAAPGCWSQPRRQTRNWVAWPEGCSWAHSSGCRAPSSLQPACPGDNFQRPRAAGTTRGFGCCLAPAYPRFFSYPGLPGLTFARGISYNHPEENSHTTARPFSSSGAELLDWIGKHDPALGAEPPATYAASLRFQKPAVHPQPFANLAVAPGHRSAVSDAAALVGG